MAVLDDPQQATRRVTPSRSPKAATGDRLAAVAGDLDAAVVAERQRWARYRSDLPRTGFPSSFVKFDLSGG